MDCVTADLAIHSAAAGLVDRPLGDGVVLGPRLVVPFDRGIERPAQRIEAGRGGRIVRFGGRKRRARGRDRAGRACARQAARVAIHGRELRQQRRKTFGHVCGNGALARDCKGQRAEALAAVAARGRNCVAEGRRDGCAGNLDIAHSDGVVQVTRRHAHGHHRGRLHLARRQPA